MAKVKIQGHASGTGVLTVTAPNTSTDRTITLPDATGTLATTADTGVDGITSSADATAINIDSSENVHIINGGKYLRFAYNNSNSHSAFQGWKHLQFGNNGANYIIGGNTATGGSLKFVVNNSVEMSSDNATSHNGTVSLELRADGRATSQFTANAWANYNGTGTPAIRDSHNVSSLTDVGTGEHKINLTSNMNTADHYTVASSCSKGSGAPADANAGWTTHGESLPVTGPYIGTIFNGSASDRLITTTVIFGD